MAKRPQWVKDIALDRIEILMQRADDVFHEDRERADRYAELARKIAMRHNARMPKRWKRRICKKCHAFLKPGYNCRVRTKDGKMVVTCLECGNVARMPFTAERRLRRSKNVDEVKRGLEVRKGGLR
ncbi:MAG: ribonuclease P protein component 4 [Candidatus Hydrothermarchaeales archaeon]